jgi:iron complex outermembrane recepter protein
MRKIFTLLAVLVASLAGFAQSKGSIMGRVIDGSEKTVEAATISLVRAVDSSLVKISVATKEGQFVFEDVQPGIYIVTITAVGHQKAFSEKIQVSDNSQPIQLKTIELLPASKSMAGVTVTAKKPMIEQKIDRTVVNVDASVTNAGNTALEVLEKSPGISVDRDGNISPNMMRLVMPGS